MEAPAYSLASRAKELKKFSTPAPGAYEVSALWKKSLVASISSNFTWIKKFRKSF